MLKEKSLEEINGILQTFPEAFKERFGRKITKQELIKHLNDRILSEEMKQLKTQFDNFTPQALKAAISTIEQGSFENIDNGQVMLNAENPIAQIPVDYSKKKKWLK